MSLSCSPASLPLHSPTSTCTAVYHHHLNNVGERPNEIVAVLDLKTDRERGRLLVRKWTWLRKGAVWSTRVHPRNMGGPTVVRVMADDEFGTPIGRNFIEIDYKTQGTRYF